MKKYLPLAAFVLYIASVLCLDPIALTAASGPMGPETGTGLAVRNNAPALISPTTSGTMSSSNITVTGTLTATLSGTAAHAIDATSSLTSSTSSYASTSGYSTTSGTTSGTAAHVTDLTLSGPLITSGAYSTTLTTTGTTNVTLPTTGTLTTLAGTEELTNKTLNASVGKGTWTASGTWTLPAVTLGGAVLSTGTTTIRNLTSDNFGNGLNLMRNGTSDQYSAIVGGDNNLYVAYQVAGTSTWTEALHLSLAGAVFPGTLGVTGNVSFGSSAYENKIDFGTMPNGDGIRLGQVDTGLGTTHKYFGLNDLGAAGSWMGGTWMDITGDNSGNYGFRWQTQNYGVGNPVMTLNYQGNLSVPGNVGIGTTDPSAKLSINGGLHVGGDSDPGDNNAVIDGTLGVTGAVTGASFNAITQTAQSTGFTISGGTTSKTLTLDADITASAIATAPGAWTTPSYSSGDFTAAGSMTWTVEAGDVGTYAYTINGKVMTVALSLGATTIAGTPSSQIMVKIPATKTATKTMTNSCLVNDNGTLSAGYEQVAASGTNIVIQKLTGNFTASTNQTGVDCEITFEIN